MENENLPFVSVIIPTYKRAEMLSRAIASVLEQSYSPIEILVIDDNNPDTEWRQKTAAIMEGFRHIKHVRYICHNQNMNGSVARNTGMQNAFGDIVCFLDDDDWYLPNKVEKQVFYLLNHPEHRAVYCGWIRDYEIVQPVKEGNLSFELLSGTNLIYTNVIMMWRIDALACGGWDETFKRHQEAAFLLRYFRNHGTIGVVNEALVQFDTSDRSNAASNSDVNEQQTFYYLNCYQDIIEACENVSKGKKKTIISYRTRSILLGHLKSKNFKSAIRLYFLTSLKFPIKFNYDLIKYTIFWIKRKKKCFYANS